jgi:hypothetical protein
MDVPDFSPEERRLLELIYAGLVEAGTWPTTAFVDARLAADDGLDIDEVLAGMPRDAVIAAGGYGANSKIHMGIWALASVPAAAEDLERFVELVRFAAERERQTLPGPLEAGQTNLGPEDAKSIWDEPPDTAALTRVLAITALEPLHVGMGGPNDDGTWSVSFDRKVRRYRDVRDIADYLQRRPGPVQAAWAAPSAVGPYVFVLMPFEQPWSANVKAAIDHACMETSRLFATLSWERADDITEPGRITDQIISAIEQADLLVADITASNPNVLFELGYADALRKPIIVLNQDLAATPFDIKDWRQIAYAQDALGDLSGSLAGFLSGTLRTLGFT